MNGKPLLQFACRHHIFELVCEAVCSIVYGRITGPTQGTFKKLIAHWAELGKRQFSSIEVCHNNRHLATMVRESATVLQQWLKNNADELYAMTIMSLFSVSFVSGKLCLRRFSCK